MRRTGAPVALLLFVLLVQHISAVVLSVPDEITLDQDFAFNWTRGAQGPANLAAVMLWPVSSNGSDALAVHHINYYLNMSSQSSGMVTWQFSSADPTMQPGTYFIYAIPPSPNDENVPPSGNTIGSSMVGLSNQFTVSISPTTCSAGSATCTNTSVTSQSPSTIPPSFATPSQQPSPSAIGAGTSGNHSGMMIGFILGSVLVVILLVALIFYLLLRRRRRRRAANVISVEEDQNGAHSKLESESTRAVLPSVKSSESLPNLSPTIKEKSARFNTVKKTGHSRAPSALERSWWDDVP